MTCIYCGARNNDTEHRCRRCGRRPGDTLNEGLQVQRTNGALATKPWPSEVADPIGVPQAAAAPVPARPFQASLFPSAHNVIPIESYTAVPPKPPGQNTPARAQKQPPRRPPRLIPGQGELDFLPPAQNKPRTLGTTVEAVIYCEAPVATPLHRAVAGVLDGSMVMIAYGLFLLTFSLFGGEFNLTPNNLLIFGGILLLLSFSYGLFWAVAGTESAGMRWTHLRVITFDGARPDFAQRIGRFAAACLSACTILGLLWSLADEESLTWQDHISRTFPTPHELESRVFRRR